ncbi:MAG: flagellar biosynthesis protein FlhA [Eubacteriales bacterium]|nr:flagellar biosynthesis protein FlhA [Eubacteriales bacterium]
MKITDIVVAVFILVIVLLIIIPLTPGVMDAFLVTNISLSLLILLTTLYIKKTLDFSTYPTVLLIITLFRLALNISSTRLILSNGGDAGNVIKAFGSFVVGSNLIVGLVVFLIIVVVQFIVITKGAERVAEVAARFTLDAMPGKQMAIDADLSSGLINESEARERRQDIQREADFYGAMDGASKFVKGDAIVGIVITLINIIGGIVIGLLGVGGSAMDFSEVITVYTLATVGDGLCSQIPALLISTATGIIVTRAATKDSFGQDLSRQLFSKPYVFYILGGMVALIGFIPGLPTVLFIVVGIVLIVVGYVKSGRQKKTEEAQIKDRAETSAAEKRKPESVTSLLHVDLIEMEFGYGLISLVDASQGGDLLDRVVMIRRQCALDLGIIVPIVRLRDNIQLGRKEYVIKIKGIDVARGEVMLDHFLALKPDEVDEPIDGIETVEPAFGLPALWIAEGDREKAELKGYTTIDVPSVISTHLMEVIKRHADELLGRQQVQTIIDNLKKQQPALVEEVVPKMFTIGEIQKVLSNLLRENISIRDIGTILEILGDYGAITRDTDTLTEYVRQKMKRAITKRFVPGGRARVITLSPDLEKAISESIRKTDNDTHAALEPGQIQKILASLKKTVNQALSLGVVPMVLTSPLIRRHIKTLSSSVYPELVVLSYNELEQDIEIYSDWVVSL